MNFFFSLQKRDHLFQKESYISSESSSSPTFFQWIPKLVFGGILNTWQDVPQFERDPA